MFCNKSSFLLYVIILENILIRTDSDENMVTDDN